jgi:protocadherin Fat 1/2/3
VTYNLTVSVTDGRHVVHATVLVTVINNNEKRPQFVGGSTFEVQLPENAAVGTRVVRINVTDGDAGQKVFFGLHGSQHIASIEKFKMDPVSGDVSVKQSLDRERIRTHVLIVFAKDEGTPTKTNYARLVIHITDHNDHAPTFTSKLVESRIHETAAIGSHVLQLFAVDGDHGDNGRVTYSIVSGNVGNAFAVDETSGVITVARKLDLNVQGEYMLMVRAADHGSPPLSNAVPVHIVLTMADDAPPKFGKSHYAAEVYENLAKGKTILTVEARARSSLRYEIVSGNDDQTFVVSPSTGHLMLQRGLDFEKTHFYNLTLSVSNLVSMD